ncbi:NAD(P)-dependent dehydrogenase (short-subunit alcohol dehydrogenase family) [Filimonas zeae]|uniref:Short chain dehydrogenase n=1 Tax=Filimonas zeae TaxID=1737353 RepID=A0A917IV14_9BACT|nr:glucose 1-dehydrogenase [Filimonas zeae]MDR6339244.1 NAD(P)-dependent dehydrogenase (short-subunit alcohol dehydrogenase family) [Filimonas zeae]GGH64451.1 short chain dehydrogenase [Filimonas zeae]
MNILTGKVAVITGGAAGIGKATAQRFLAEGAKVMIVDIQEEQLQKTVAEFNTPDISYSVADVSSEKDAARYISETITKFGSIDIVFANAGIEGIMKPVQEYPTEVFDKVYAVNVRGTFLTLKYAIPVMADGGSIIITSSIGGFGSSPFASGYVATKHAVMGIMRTAALELANRKIRVNTVHPSQANTRMMKDIEKDLGITQTSGQAFAAGIPLGRYAEPEEIASMVTYLASDESRFITGTTFRVDGGMDAPF